MMQKPFGMNELFPLLNDIDMYICVRFISLHVCVYFNVTCKIHTHTHTYIQT